MKKILLLSLAFIITGFAANVMAQEVITGFTFPTGDTLTDIYPDQGLPANTNYYLSSEDTTAHPNTIKRQVEFTNGATTFAATAVGWDNGSNAKLWSIKFKAEGFMDLKVSSKQSSGGNKPGPRDFQIQARKSGSDWVNIGNPVTTANDWTTGVVTELELPDEFDNPGTTSIYIRWIMISNLDINGDPVAENGISKIDDILITGTSVSGIEESLFDSRFSYYPNPATNGTLNIKSEIEIQEVSILDMQGRTVINFEKPGNKIDISNLKSGVYFIRSIFENGQAVAAHRLIVR